MLALPNMNANGNANVNAPRRWPHILIEAGPSIAGLEVGDMLPFSAGSVVNFWASGWSPFTNMQRGPVSRPALTVRVASEVSGDGRAYRFVDDPPRVFRNDAPLRGSSSSGSNSSNAGIGGNSSNGSNGNNGNNSSSNAAVSGGWIEEPSDLVVNVSKWRLRFVLDGPPLATVRRFGPYVACRPSLVGAALNATVARSEWLIANDGARQTLVVDQAFDGGITWRASPRASGKSLDEVRTSIAHAHAHALDHDTTPKLIDKELAAGIVAQISDTQRAALLLGYDGVVRSLEPLGERSSGVRARVYRTLTRGESMEWQHSDDEMAAELRATTPASVEQLRAMMHGLFADAAAREAAIVEECAVLAG